MTDRKLVIVMRTDLNMRKGKMIAQGAHAAMMPLITGKFNIPAPVWEWIYGSAMAKICVQVGSEQELLDIEAKAQEAGLEVHAVMDAGFTEFHGEPTRTCCAIGPDLSAKIDAITGHLKLL